jgi:hypothetical protein
MGNDNHVVVVSQKLCGFQGRVCGRVVMMKEPVVVAPKFQSFSSHIFSQASQNVTVKVRVDRHFRRKKFTVNQWMSSRNFSTFSVVLLVLGRPERLSSSTDTRPALKREWHSKTAARLKECSYEAFQEVR